MKQRSAFAILLILALGSITALYLLVSGGYITGLSYAGLLCGWIAGIAFGVLAIGSMKGPADARAAAGADAQIAVTH